MCNQTRKHGAQQKRDVVLPTYVQSRLFFEGFGVRSTNIGSCTPNYPKLGVFQTNFGLRRSLLAGRDPRLQKLITLAVPLTGSWSSRWGVPVLRLCSCWTCWKRSHMETSTNKKCPIGLRVLPILIRTKVFKLQSCLPVTQGPRLFEPHWPTKPKRLAGMNECPNAGNR